MASSEIVRIWIKLKIARTIFFSPFPEVKEYCSSESFEVQCGENEVILMVMADYGRRQPGRCISGDYGHLTSSDGDHDAGSAAA